MIPPFKAIPGFDNRFAATSEGEIYDVVNKCYLHKTLHQGRCRVYLPGFETHHIYRLISLAYHGEPPFENADVHHDNGNPLDNTPENLVYLTRSVHTKLHMLFDENRREKIRKTAPINAKKSAYKRSKPVLQYDLQGNFIAEYYSAHEAARQTGIVRSSITRCCNGEYKSAGGFKWKYASP